MPYVLAASGRKDKTMATNDKKYRVPIEMEMVNARNFLGYDKDKNGKLIINPEQAEIVKRIFREYLEGASCKKIARGLERDGILTARGNTRWHDSCTPAKNIYGGLSQQKASKEYRHHAAILC